MSKIALLLGNDYGVRVVEVVEGEDGRYRIVEPDPIVWFDSRYSDDPPVDCDDDDEIPAGLSEHHYLDDMFLQDMWEYYLAKSWSDWRDEEDIKKAVEEYKNEKK